MEIGKEANMIELRVYGRPATAGSKSAFHNKKTGKVIVAPAGKFQRPWMDSVLWTFLQSKWSRMIPYEGAIILTVTIYFVRPKSHYGTGRNSGILKKTARKRPSTRPDLSKLVRAVEDSLTGYAYKDDGQVVILLADKVYGKRSGAKITIKEIEEDTNG